MKTMDDSIDDDDDDDDDDNDTIQYDSSSSVGRR